MVLSIILVVLFTMVMFLWGLGLRGEGPVRNESLLAWIACLLLGIVVFLSGFGVIVWRAS